MKINWNVMINMSLLTNIVRLGERIHRRRSHNHIRMYRSDKFRYRDVVPMAIVLLKKIVR